MVKGDLHVVKGRSSGAKEEAFSILHQSFLHCSGKVSVAKEVLDCSVFVLLSGKPLSNSVAYSIQSSSLTGLPSTCTETRACFIKKSVNSKRN